ncbi:hypothetical protein FLL45_11290 [Aliikangiella marina]|uniref:Uncharacterized protein n=1 Tax=Aliikangiella marina TaxID=1712262 RepID=A0A545TE45_9GAMM|nr:hypothetical protein [Aliikangiella marina]TQV75493.1 hypothetical protein FLL45_11290 [Aliikangiella marina]
MNYSEKQFNALLAQIFVRTDQMLLESDNVIPYGLTLNQDNQVEILVAANVSEKLSDCLAYIQDELREKLQSEDFVATAVVFADYDNMEIIAMLENNQNYCLKVLIPVINEQHLRIDVNQIKTEAGAVYIFPFVS